MTTTTNFILVFASALLLAAGATPIVRQAAVKVGLVDRPNARKVHTNPTPLMGGTAIYIAFIVALLLFGYRYYVGEVVGIFLGATLVSFLGLWDDRLELPAWAKFLGQIAATGVLYLSGVRVAVLPWPVANALITVLWVVGITNALNLLDNMDGLAGGVAAVAAAFFVLLAGLNGQYLVGALAAAVLGASLGFLIYNFNPASIFMGDQGALFLGFMLAAIGIKLRFPMNSPFVTWMVPVMVLALPIFDTTLVVFSRLRRGVNPFSTPGKDHLSHRLVNLGYTRREAVLLCYLIAGACGMLAVFITQANMLEGYLVGGCVALIGLWAIWWLERSSRQGSGQGPENKERL
jgi:UDP-GlcNAc:undecaprenyl-phosphate GlcNAc-1-phosphate transferase